MKKWFHGKEKEISNMAAEGKTAAEIAFFVSDHNQVVTRNSVIGYCRRNEIKFVHNKYRGGARPKKTEVGLKEYKPNGFTCKSVIGDPKEISYCGLPAVYKDYCLDHARIYFKGFEG